MNLKQKVMLAVLALLLAVCGILWIRTAPPTAKTVRRHAAELAAAELVDRSTYTNAERQIGRAHG